MARYYHGGFGGLRLGQSVLPPATTGVPSTASFGAAGICRTDRVYITTRFDSAYAFACLHWTGAGKVYEVEPQGVLEHDPDATQAGYSFQCEAARVVRVHRVKGKDIKNARKYAGVA